MTDSATLLVANLRKAARIVRAGGDVHSDYFISAAEFASEIERLASLVERSSENPVAFVRAFLAKKKAKLTWCAPTFDLDDYLAGTNGSADLGNAIYESL